MNILNMNPACKRQGELSCKWIDIYEIQVDSDMN